MRRRWTENLLLIAGLLAVNVWIWSHAATVIFQKLDERNFEQEKPRTPEIARAPVRRSDGRVGRLIIPRLRLRAMVREGTSEATLSLAAGHIPSTSLPGQQGNVGVAGHRDTLFRGLKDIHKNDLILFETLAGKYSYRVESTKIVKPEDVSVLSPGSFPELTLVTCYPFHYIGNAPDRFIVKARQVIQQDVTPTVPVVRKKRSPVRHRAGDSRAQVRRPRRVEIAALSRPDAATSKR